MLSTPQPAHRHQSGQYTLHHHAAARAGAAVWPGGQSFFANEIINATGSGSGAVQRNLRGWNILAWSPRAGSAIKKHYQANRDSPGV